MQKKKLQVFVSSTYLDLKEERQAAVEAILSAGHIPAGMELFTAGDQSQWQVIKEWIRESDVFILLLGGRYGSVEPESGKSYIQLEYEYAIELGKPFFAIVISETALDNKIAEMKKNAVEMKNQQLYEAFKNTVTSKMVKFWTDVKDIKLAIYEKLGDYGRREDLIGWIPGNQGINGAEIAEEITRLNKENLSLKNQIKEFQESRKAIFFGVEAEIFVEQLKREIVDFNELTSLWHNKGYLDEALDKDRIVNLLSLFEIISNNSVEVLHMVPGCVKRLISLGLVEIVQFNKDSNFINLTNEGRQLYLFLSIEKTDL